MRRRGKPTLAQELVPMVIEQAGRGERSYDIFSRLLKDRIIFLGTEINDQVSSVIIAQLLFLQLDDPKEDISIYVMSPGGEISAALAIYDTMQHVKNDVATYCVGQAASAAALILAAGKKGKRLALPSSRIMIHQPWGAAIGDAQDIQIQAKEMQHLKRLVCQKLAKHTGKSEKQIEKDCDRDFFMSAAEAQEYGIVDKVLPD